MERIDIPPTFWILCLEPLRVVRRGGGTEPNGAPGDSDWGGETPVWTYERRPDGTWDCVPGADSDAPRPPPG